MSQSEKREAQQVHSATPTKAGARVCLLPARSKHCVSARVIRMHEGAGAGLLLTCAARSKSFTQRPPPGPAEIAGREQRGRAETLAGTSRRRGRLHPQTKDGGWTAQGREERPGLGVRVALWSWTVRRDNVRRADSLPPPLPLPPAPARDCTSVCAQTREEGRPVQDAPPAPRREEAGAAKGPTTSSSCSSRGRVRPGRQPGLAQHQRPLPLPLDARPH